MTLDASPQGHLHIEEDAFWDVLSGEPTNTYLKHPLIQENSIAGSFGRPLDLRHSTLQFEKDNYMCQLTHS
jgi:hypothetical protein